MKLKQFATHTMNASIIDLFIIDCFSPKPKSYKVALNTSWELDSRLVLILTEWSLKVSSSNSV